MSFTDPTEKVNQKLAIRNESQNPFENFKTPLKINLHFRIERCFAGKGQRH